MAITGWRTAASVSEGSLSGSSWTNLSVASMRADDSNSASCSAALTTNAICCFDFGFDLQADFVGGIEARVNVASIAAQNVCHIVVSKAGCLAGIDGTRVTTTSGVQLFGGPLYRWGFTSGLLTVADVEATTFGVYVWADTAGASVSCTIDSVQLRLYFTEPGMSMGHQISSRGR